MAATTDLLNIIVVIALVVMMTKAMEDMARPLDGILIRKLSGNAYVSYWVVGLAMLVLSWFIWPTPCTTPFRRTGRSACRSKRSAADIAAMAMSIFGKGVGLSSDFIIQGSPSVTSKLTKIPIDQIISASVPVWLAVSVTAVADSYFIAIRSIRASKRGVSDKYSSDQQRRYAETSNRRFGFRQCQLHREGNGVGHSDLIIRRHLFYEYNGTARRQSNRSDWRHCINDYYGQLHLPIQKRCFFKSDGSC